MRLWHKDLIPILPRQQLLGQWRECCSIATNISKYGSPNHILVNKIMDYDLYEFYSYGMYIAAAMIMRGYRCDVQKFVSRLPRIETKYDTEDLVDLDDLFIGWHNDRYLRQCFTNLEEKYDCGGLSEEEFEPIKEYYFDTMREKFQANKLGKGNEREAYVCRRLGQEVWRVSQQH